LIADYLTLETRITKLSEREGDAESGGIHVTRAINVAVAERHRLRAALFRAARKLDEELPPLPTPAQTRERQAYTAWTHFFEGLDEWKDRGPEDRAKREAELTRLYGEPSMRVLRQPRVSTPTRESVAEFYDWAEAQ
jgi:hypothetical protein